MPAANAQTASESSARGRRHAAAIARSSTPRQRAPSAASLARASYVSRPAAPIASASAGVGGEAPDGGRERGRVAGGNEERVLAVGQQLAGGRACRP